MIQLIIISALLIVSAIAKAVQDKINFHYYESIFKNAKPTSWWNPLYSHTNKHNWSKNKFITWCLSTWAVSITDAWHLFGLIRDFSIYCAVVVALGNWWLFLGYIPFRGVFHLFFTYIFKRKS
jgi:hypothetical protein